MKAFRNLQDKLGLTQEPKELLISKRAVALLLIGQAILFIVFNFLNGETIFPQDFADWCVCAWLLILMGGCLYSWHKITCNIEKKKIFTYENADTIIYLGNFFCFMAIFLMPGHLRSQQAHLIILCLFCILMGVFFYMIGFMIKKGVDLQEEQELTI